MSTKDLLLFQMTSTYDQPILRSMPLREQPAYRVTQNPNACNLTKLMAAVIGGTRQIEIAQDLIAHFGDDIRSLYQAHPAELAKVRGISQTTAVRIKAALNLGLRLNLPGEERPSINTAADAAALVQAEMALLETEHLRVLLLDRRNRVLDIVKIYRGSVSSSQVRIGEVFRPAIQRMASAIVVCHNHPTNDPTPSPVIWPSHAPSCRRADYWTFRAWTTWSSDMVAGFPSRNVASASINAQRHKDLPCNK